MPNVVASSTKRPPRLRETHGQSRYPPNWQKVKVMLMMPMAASEAFTTRTK